MSNLPQLSNEQRQEALAKALQARQERSAVLKALKSGDVAIDVAIDDPVIQRVKVCKFIAACPGYGKAKATQLMVTISIAENRRVGGLGTRQKSELLEALCGGEA